MFILEDALCFLSAALSIYNTTGKNTLDEAPIDTDEGLTSKSGLLQQSDEIQPLLSFFTVVAVFLAQLRFSET